MFRNLFNRTGQNFEIEIGKGETAVTKMEDARK